MTSMYIFLTFYLALVLFLAWKNFRLALGILIIALPSYLIRFRVGPLPTTVLELTFGILFLVWLIKYARRDVVSIKYQVLSNKLFFIFCGLFFLASLAGIFISDMWWASLGQWRAYFLEPMALFVMLVGRTSKSPLEGGSRGVLANTDIAAPPSHTPLPPSRGDLQPANLVLFLALSTLPISALAIIQYLTGALYPPSLWDDELVGRVTSFFTSPNALGLYLGPALMLMIGVIASPGLVGAKQPTELPNGLVLKARGWLRRPALWPAGLRAGLLAMTTLALLALFFSHSLGAWAAVGIGLLLFVYLIGYKKTALVALGFILIAIITPPGRAIIAAKSQSLANRLTLWNHTWEYLTANPKNFIFGAGLRQYFRKVEKPYYKPRELERLIYPHNIFLNFWTETGLLGLVSFGFIFYHLAHIAYQTCLHTNKLLGASLLAALAAFFIHGLIDVPFFKNDLAMLFWVMAAVAVTNPRATASL